jgi:hypothetical protein
MMTSGTLRPANNLTAHGAVIVCGVEESCFAFSFFSFSAANGAGGAMV